MAPRRKNKLSSAVRFRITRAGWMFLLVSILVGLAAVRSQAPLMFVLFGGMMGALHISAILARRMLSAVDVHRESPSRVWQNQTVHTGYFLRNASRRRPGLAMGLRQMTPDGIESTSGFCAYLPGAGSFRAGARFVASRRGRFELQGIRLSTFFPFGLIEASKGFPGRSTLIVWPARGRLKRRLLRHGAVESSTSAPSGVSGGQDEFFGLREYREGDHHRWIHWRRSAGRPLPVVREMAKPLPEILWVILDTYDGDASAAPTAERERMIRFAATLIDHAFARQYRVGLALAFQDGPRILPPGPGRGQRRDLLDALAEIGPNGRWTLADTAALLRRSQLEQAQVVVVTPRGGRGAETLMGVRRHCRHLRVVAGEAIDEFFVDEPHASGEAS